MRVTFPRLPDNQRSYALVERDDGVLCPRISGIAGPRLSRDLMQLIVERELRITDGVWAGVAAGTPAGPGASARAGAARAELLAELVAEVAALEVPTLARIQRLATARLPGTAIEPPALAAAAQALQVEAARWAHLRVGEQLRYTWPVDVRYRPAS
jgi:hypothetical protein